ncbi:MAG: nucleoside deaminase [Haliscomenobacter sp.]
MLDDTYYMREALKEAQQAYAEGEIPVGAVVVSEGRVIAKGRNATERLQDVTAHAEIIAITAAANYLGSKYLSDCVLYVTLEPCPMCAGALAWAQVGRVVYGASDEKRGFLRFGSGMLHPKTIQTTGVLESECRALMLAFFKERRGA